MILENTVKSFLDMRNFAVVGSFKNETKHAYRILKKLLSQGYNVYPVNPGLKEVEGLKCYANIGDIDEQVDVVNLVTPPAKTEKVLIECMNKGIQRIWMQPGAESEKAIKFCKDNNMKVVYGTCVLLQAN